jgi:phosphomannomutase
MLAALFALAELGESDLPLSELFKPYNRYLASGEINTVVADAQASMASIVAAYEASHEIDDLDGITVTGQGYWFNVRPSNTEPLLRLNVEAGTQAELERVTKEVQKIIG